MKKKKIVYSVLAAVAVIAVLAVAVFLCNQHSMPKLGVQSAAVSLDATEDGKPQEILTDRAQTASQGFYAIDQSEGKLVLSAKAEWFSFEKECTLRLYFVHPLDECQYDGPGTSCVKQDYGKTLTTEVLTKTDAGYYLYSLNDLGNLEPGHYYAAFQNENEITETSIDFILQ